MTFNANGIGRQAYEVRTQSRGLRIRREPVLRDTSETSSEVLHCTLWYLSDWLRRRAPRRCCRRIKKYTLHLCVELSPLLSVEAAEICIPTGNIEALLIAVYESPQRLWWQTSQLIGCRSKSIMVGDLNAKRPTLRGHYYWHPKLRSPTSNF
jgi:hypothetical protein